MAIISADTVVRFVILLFVAGTLVWIGMQSWVVSPFNAIAKFLGYALFIIAAFDLIVFLLRMVFPVSN